MLPQFLSPSREKRSSAGDRARGTKRASERASDGRTHGAGGATIIHISCAGTAEWFRRRMQAAGRQSGRQSPRPPSSPSRRAIQRAKPEKILLPQHMMTMKATRSGGGGDNHGHGEFRLRLLSLSLFLSGFSLSSLVRNAVCRELDSAAPSVRRSVRPSPILGAGEILMMELS